MLRIGVTGGIGSGKTTIANLFAKLGVPVIDADEIARTLLEPGKETYNKVVARFGDNILQADKSINRSELRELVFSDKDNKKLLENILHPEVYKQIVNEVSKLQSAYCIIVVPLLIEADFLDLVDRVLVIDADESVRITRVMERNGMARQDIENIINSQSSNQEKLKIADDVINNSGDETALTQQVNELHKKYTLLSGGAR
jgi:dephospho-CoA kinase